MIKVDNNAMNPPGLSNSSPAKSELGPKLDQNFASLIQQNADKSKNSGGDTYNNLLQRFDQDTAPLPNPMDKAVNALVDEITGKGSSLDELLGQVVNSVKSGNPLSDYSSPLSAANGMNDEDISNIAKQLLGGLASKSKSSDELLGQLVKGMHDATGNLMSAENGMSDKVISQAAIAVLDRLAGKSESMDKLLDPVFEKIMPAPTSVIMYGIAPPTLPDLTIELPNENPDVYVIYAVEPPAVTLPDMPNENPDVFMRYAVEPPPDVYMRYAVEPPEVTLPDMPNENPDVYVIYAVEPPAVTLPGLSKELPAENSIDISNNKPAK